MLSLKNCRLPISEQVADVVVSQGSIAEIRLSDERSVKFILPGMIDIHCHGAVGVDVNAADAEGLVKVAEFLAYNGVTTWLPTLVPDSDENYRRIISEIDRLMELQREMPVAQAVGVHYEGVFANEKMCGALRPQYFKKGVDAIASLPRLRSGVHMTTLAPEVEGGVEIVSELSRQGWIVSIGHTRADVPTLEHAFEAGARHMTHFFNAMTGIHHRDLGVAGWGISREGVTIDIIPDGIHVDARMLRLACEAKRGSTALISDSVALAGLGDGEYEMWGEKISVSNGRTENERGSIAGSVITLADGLKLLRKLGFGYDAIAEMTSTTAAKILGLIGRGTISAGDRADLIVLDDIGEIEMVIIGGQEVKR